MNYSYYVVEFSNSPYAGIDKYVCIPESWIQLRKIAGKGAVVKFPVEDLSVTKIRVKDGEVPSDGWQIYGAKIKYYTDSYEDAENYIGKLEKKVINKHKSSGPIDNGDGPSKKLKSVRRSERIQVINRPQITDNDTTLNSINNGNIPQGKENESTANHDGIQLTNESSDHLRISKSMSNTGNPGQEKSTIHNLLFLDQARDAFTQHCASLEKIINIINSHCNSGNYKLSNTTMRNPVVPVGGEKECEEKEIKKTTRVLKRTHAEIGIIKRKEQNEEEIEDSFDNEEEEDDDDSDYDNNDNDGDNDVKDDDDNDYDNDGEDYDDDYVKRKRFQSRKLVLPPEYDKNDSKWTLRYREYAPGLVELMEDTGVYVNAVKLLNCKRLAKNSKALARLLLLEIFAETALYTCSLTGIRASAFDFDGTHIRPGLNEHARIVLLNYVEEYAEVNKWPKIDNQCLLNSLRNKMQEIRFKYKK